MDDFNSEISSKPTNSKSGLKRFFMIGSLFLTILLVAIIAYYNPWSQEEPDNAPPTLSIEGSTYQGLSKVTDDKWLEHTEEDRVAAANLADNLGETFKIRNFSKLKIPFYYNSATTFENPMKNILTEAGNMCIFAYYSPEDGKFILYEKGPFSAEGAIVPKKEDLDDYTIAKGNWFIAMCFDPYSTILMNTGYEQPSTSATLDDKKEQWHPLFFQSDKDLITEVKSCENRVEVLWLQDKDWWGTAEDPYEGFVKADLTKLDDLNLVKKDSNSYYHLTWVKLKGDAGTCEEVKADDPDDTANKSAILMDTGSTKLEVIKAIREATGLGLKETKDMTDSIPSIVLAHMTMADAEALKLKIEAVGATIRIQDDCKSGEVIDDKGLCSDSYVPPNDEEEKEPEFATILVEPMIESNSIAITWTPVTNAAYYHVYLRPPDGNVSSYKISDVNKREYIFTGLESETAYKVEVKTWDSNDKYIGASGEINTTTKKAEEPEPDPEPESECNNGIVEEGELCDKDDLDQNTCQSIGFDGGTITCTNLCSIDSSNCFTAEAVGGIAAQSQGSSIQITWGEPSSTSFVEGYSIKIFNSNQEEVKSSQQTKDKNYIEFNLTLPDGTYKIEVTVHYPNNINSEKRSIDHVIGGSG